MKADYIHKDSLTLGELDGVKVMLSPEAYAEVKKQKIIEENNILKEQQQELERYKNIISKIETLVINHNCDTGDIYYKYNGKYLKSELKDRILELLELKGKSDE